MTFVNNITTCEVKQRLQAELETAHRWVMTVDDRVVKAMIQGHLEALKELEEFLALAREERRKASEAYLVHLREHGC